MSNSHDNFDEAKLNERKEKNCGYRFCPLCGEILVEQELDGTLRLKCSHGGCDFIYYQNPVPAAGAIVVKDDQLLLVKRAHPPKVGWWCIPAGFMEWREHPEQTAMRELKEETGLEVELTGLFEIYSGTDDPRANAVLILYLAQVTGGTLQAADDALEVRFFDFDSLPKEIAFEAHHQAIADYDRRIRQASR